MLSDGVTLWRPALAEIEEALVPAFIVEELEDGRFMVFAPSVPTPLAGSLYILTPDRVHPVDISFTQAIQSVSRWGSGSKEWVASNGEGRDSDRGGTATGREMTCHLMIQDSPEVFFKGSSLRRFAPQVHGGNHQRLVTLTVTSLSPHEYNQKRFQPIQRRGCGVFLHSHDLSPEIDALVPHLCSPTVLGCHIIQDITGH